jgi:transcriptional regulator with XRE-family HTH domain
MLVGAKSTTLISHTATLTSVEEQASPALGAEIRNRRLAADVTQVDLAAQVGVGQTAISQWERSVTVPTLSNLARLAKALDCDLSDLLATAT